MELKTKTKTKIGKKCKVRTNEIYATTVCKK